MPRQKTGTKGGVHSPKAYFKVPWAETKVIVHGPDSQRKGIQTDHKTNVVLMKVEVAKKFGLTKADMVLPTATSISVHLPGGARNITRAVSKGSQGKYKSARIIFITPQEMGFGTKKKVGSVSVPFPTGGSVHKLIDKMKTFTFVEAIVTPDGRRHTLDNLFSQ